MEVLAIGAHFDDIELGCGGSLVKHIKNKDKVYMYVITDSEYDDYDGTIMRTKDVALEEGKNAIPMLGVGVDNLICEDPQHSKMLKRLCKMRKGLVI